MNEFTHAGGIVFRRVDHEPRYLVITAKGNPEHWVFPKGHRIPGESLEGTAKREVLEETGVETQVLEPVGIQQFQGPKETVKVKYFLLQSLGEKAPGEDRKKGWCTFEEALRTLTFLDSRELLREAHERVKKYSTQP